MSESLVERILRLQAARDRAHSQPAAPTISEDPRTATAAIPPTTNPTHNRSEQRKKRDTKRSAVAAATRQYRPPRRPIT